MKKTLCDLCDQPMTTCSRLIIKHDVDTVEFRIKVEPVKEASDVCQPCLRLALREITDEPSFRKLTDVKVL